MSLLLVGLIVEISRPIMLSTVIGTNDGYGDGDGEKEKRSI